MFSRDQRRSVYECKLTYRRFKPANVLTEEPRGPRRRGVFFFRSKLILPEGEGPAGRSKLWQETVTGGPSRQPLILFIALPEAEDKTAPG